MTEAASDEVEDVRPVRVHWPDLDGLLSGGRCRGMNQEQIDLFTSSIGYVWSRATRAGREALGRKEDPPALVAAAIFGVVSSAFGSGWSAPHLDYLNASLGLVWAAAVWRVWREAGEPIAGAVGGAVTLDQVAAKIATARPVVALSLIQPWGWIILNGGKRLENRTWRKAYPKEPIFLHASTGMKRRDYEEARQMAAVAAPGLVLPAMGDLERGGIIGQARIIGCSANDLTPHRERDPWAIPGQHGYRLTDVIALPFTPCAGMLGFWRVPANVRDMALAPRLQAVSP